MEVLGILLSSIAIFGGLWVGTRLLRKDSTRRHVSNARRLLVGFAAVAAAAATYILASRPNIPRPALLIMLIVVVAVLLLLNSRARTRAGDLDDR